MGAQLVFCWGVVSLFVFPGISWGVPASPRGVKVSQPDGTKITVYLRGDEFYSWYEDDKGYTILKDTSTKEWLYAGKGVKGALKATTHKVGANDPALLNLKKHYTDIAKVSRAKSIRSARNSSSIFSVSGSRAPNGPTLSPIRTGTMKNLVILARFSDQVTSFNQAQFDSLFNQPGYNFDGAVGSMQDYYHEVSYNKLTIQSTISQWVTLPHGYAYYGANDANGKDVNPRQMIIDAINALDIAGFDFSAFDGNNDGEVDCLTIIHSGKGEEGRGDSDYIWSHQWMLSEPIYKDGKKMQMYHTEPELRGSDADPVAITQIGVIAHETGHFLGLPDLYDYGGDSQGAGQFCLMAGGSWNGGAPSPNGDGTSPAHMSAWHKAILGWATPTQITAAGSYSLPRIEDHSTAMYWLQADAFPSSEFFLVENRQRVGFDLWIPGITNGILIWHVDQTLFWNGNNDDQTHYLVDLEEASGAQDLANNTNPGDDADYFRFGNNTSFGDGTTPNSKSYLDYNLGLLISSVSVSGNPMSFNVTLTATTRLSMGKLKAYPNPCYFDRSNLTIAGIPPDARDVKIYIYSPAGKLVRVLKSGDGINVDNIALWNGADGNGVMSASGLYIYLAKASNYDSVTGKFYIFW